jgi:L-alanine-DL-glutamate epimerase-like enolase superfamily enzyme
VSRIAAVEAIPIKVPAHERSASDLPASLPGSDLYFREPHHGMLYSRCRNAVFVKVTTDDGQVGWGETLATVAPEIAVQVVGSLLAPQLIGRDPLAVEVISTDLYRSMRNRGHFTGFFADAVAGCDTAIWDLRGRLLDRPVYTLLGGPYTERLRAYASGAPGSTPEARAESARGLVEQGFDAIKLHLSKGRRDLLETVEAVRAAVGPRVDLMVDAHNTFDLAEAIVVGRELERLDVLFFEAPIEAENVAGLTELAATLQLRIATGEMEKSRFQHRDRLVARAVDVVQPDMGFVGPSEMRRIAGLAEAFHVPVAPHLSAGLGVCIAATAHLSASIPNFLILEHQEGSFALANRLLKSPLRCEGGRLFVPDGPGFGVEPDEAALREYAVKHE